MLKKIMLLPHLNNLKIKKKFKDKTPQILSLDFYKIWEILFAFDIINTDIPLKMFAINDNGTSIQSVLFFREKFAKSNKNDEYNILKTEKIDDNFYRTFLLEDLPIDIIRHMKGKKLIDFFNVRPEYNSLKYLIQFTILFNKLYANNELLQEYIIYYNDIYNIIDNISVDDFKVQFNKYKKDLDENYKKAYDYFFGPFIGGKALNSNKQYVGFLKVKENKANNAEISPYIINKGNIGNNKDNINKFLDIGDGVELIYKNIDIKMDNVKRNIYPSFDDDI